MRREAMLGCTVVSILISLLVGLTQGVALAPGAGAPRPLFVTVLCLIYAEAGIAIICLFGLMWGDPGVIKRSPQTCFPMPGEVADRLAQGQPLDGLHNLASSGRTYCVRCLVWRENELNCHHCSTCNRCVTHFDHHCGVFGRCIAGDGFGGNMGYFKTILGMAVFGCVSGTHFELGSRQPALWPPLCPVGSSGSDHRVWLRDRHHVDHRARGLAPWRLKVMHERQSTGAPGHPCKQQPLSGAGRENTLTYSIPARRM